MVFYVCFFLGRTVVLLWDGGWRKAPMNVLTSVLNLSICDCNYFLWAFTPVGKNIHLRPAVFEGGVATAAYGEMLMRWWVLALLEVGVTCYWIGLMYLQRTSCASTCLLLWLHDEIMIWRCSYDNTFFWHGQQGYTEFWKGFPERAVLRFGRFGIVSDATRETRQSKSLRQVFARTTILEKCTSVQGIELWNSPKHIQCTTGLLRFRECVMGIRLSIIHRWIKCWIRLNSSQYYISICTFHCKHVCKHCVNIYVSIV